MTEGAPSAVSCRTFRYQAQIGSVLCGSGYLLLAFLQGDLVDRWQWLTSKISQGR
jgi:chromate transporter